MIEFLCPNGHKIRCPDEQAGRAARCPRCGVKFRIPALSDHSAEPARNSDSNISTPELTDSADLSSSLDIERSPETPREKTIEFLCPRGHHLHGPASLQGRPGECPECGSRFRIPTLDDGSPPEPPEEEISLESGDRIAKHAEEPSPAAPVVPSASHEPARAQPSLSPVPNVVQSQGAGGHPLAGLFAELWEARSEGSRVEVHLAGGGVLLPDGFAKSLSPQDHAVFVTREPDDSFTLTVVPWASVSKVVLRGVRQVPGGMS